MGRKPMLLGKINENSRGKGREVIGLIGTHHGCGVTYTGLMLAFYLGEELGRRTAFLECNSHGDMELLRNAYDWTTEEASSFSFHQITCYSRVTQERIPEIFGEDYECLVLDFGTDFAAGKEELLRCGTKIIVGGRSVWDIPKLVSFTRVVQAIRGGASWLCFITQADEKTMKSISKAIGRQVRSVPYVEDPTVTTHVSNRFFDRVFGFS